MRENSKIGVLDAWTPKKDLNEKRESLDVLTPEKDSTEMCRNVRTGSKAGQPLSSPTRPYRPHLTRVDR